MRTLAIAVIVASLAVPAYAQRNQASAIAAGNNGSAEAAKAEADKKKEAQELEKAYNNTLKRIPDQSTKPKDPWGNVR
jgi:ABC-type arginine transport system permease subunit